MTSETKRCAKCGETKALTEFYLRRADGVQRINTCRDCDNSKPRSRNASKVLRVRARHRATAELIKRHDNEFRDLLDYFTSTATEEAAYIASQRSTAAGADTPRLRPGAPREGQPRTERVDTSRCEQCARHHDRGHVCTNCGARPHEIPTETSIADIASGSSQSEVGTPSTTGGPTAA